MTTAAALVVVALVAAALGWSVVVRVRGGTPAGWSWLRITLGACALVGLVVAGSALIGATPRTPPEQRGIGVLVWPSGGTPVDGLASPITVSVALEVTNCRDRVGVRLTITPAAESGTHTRPSWPTAQSSASPSPIPALTDVTASLEDDALEATVSPARELSKGKPLSIAKTDATSVPDTTMVTIEVAKWGLHQQASQPLVRCRLDLDAFRPRFLLRHPAGAVRPAHGRVGCRARRRRLRRRRRPRTASTTSLLSPHRIRPATPTTTSTTRSPVAWPSSPWARAPSIRSSAARCRTPTSEATTRGRAAAR